MERRILARRSKALPLGASTDASSNIESLPPRDREVWSRSSYRGVSPSETEYSTVADAEIENYKEALQHEKSVHDWLGGVNDVLPYLERDVLKTLSVEEITTAVSRLQDELPFRMIDQIAEECRSLFEHIVTIMSDSGERRTDLVTVLPDWQGGLGRFKLWLEEWYDINTKDVKNMPPVSEGERAQLQSLTADLDDLQKDLLQVRNIVQQTPGEHSKRSLNPILNSGDESWIYLDDVHEVKDVFETVDSILHGLFRRTKMHERHLKLKQEIENGFSLEQTHDSLGPITGSSDRTHATQPIGNKKAASISQVDPTKASNSPKASSELQRVENKDENTAVWIYNADVGQYYWHDVISDELVYQDGKRCPRNFSGFDPKMASFVTNASSVLPQNTDNRNQPWVFDDARLQYYYYDIFNDEWVYADGRRYSRVSAQTAAAMEQKSSLIPLQPPEDSRLSSQRNLWVELSSRSNTTPSGSLRPHSSADAVEPLFPEYRVRKEPRKFFTVGKVFLVLWSEPAGGGSTTSSFTDPSLSITSFGEKVFSKIRRFVVVREGRYECVVLPITSYNGRGMSKPGLTKADHAIIYTGKRPPDPTKEERPQQGEAGMLPFPIRVDPDDPSEKLDIASRICFTKPSTLFHNLKVRSFGRVNRNSMQHLVAQFKQAMFPGEEGIPRMIPGAEEDEKLSNEARNTSLTAG